MIWVLEQAMIEWLSILWACVSMISVGIPIEMEIVSRDLLHVKATQITTIRDSVSVHLVGDEVLLSEGDSLLFLWGEDALRELARNTK